jgi:hypothetical protein
VTPPEASPRGRVGARKATRRQSLTARAARSSQRVATAPAHHARRATMPTARSHFGLPYVRRTGCSVLPAVRGALSTTSSALGATRGWSGAPGAA